MMLSSVDFPEMLSQHRRQLKATEISDGYLADTESQLAGDECTVYS